MRKTSQVNNLSSCSCPFCRTEVKNYILSQSEKNRRSPQIRRFKSSEIIHSEVLEHSKQDPLNKNCQPVEIIFERSKRDRALIADAHSDHSLNSVTRGKNFYGIWRKCHDSNTRMPWSMANSYPNPQDFQETNQEYTEGPRQQSLDSRVFPFQSTPSGNLKVVPQQVGQVVFESKKVSVLVADPKHTRVNVKAELGKQENLSDFRHLYSDKNPKIMESEEVRNAKKHQILSALSLMGGEGRGAALNQILPGMPSTLSMNGQNKMKVPSQINEVLSNFVLGETPEDREHDDGHSVESDDLPKPELNLIKLGFTSSHQIDWNKIKLPQKTNLYKHMHYRITNYVNPDCLVQIEDVQFNCHLLVLQCYSSYFNEKTSREVVKLPSENVSAKAFELIYEWMTYVHGDSYTILKRDNILEVFLAAQFLGIKELEEQCWAFVDCEDLFVEDTAFILYLEAKKYGISAIMELMIPRIMKFFLTLVSSKDFLELQLDEVYVLLSSNYISVHSEIEVFMSAVRWLWHDWKERKECLEQVMSCVRFGLIAPWQLVDIRRNPENPEFLEITSHPGVQQMIDNGLAYAIIKYWYGNQTGDYYHWIDLLGLSEPPGRNWAGEEKNWYLRDVRPVRECVRATTSMAFRGVSLLTRPLAHNQALQQALHTEQQKTTAVIIPKIRPLELLKNYVTYREFLHDLEHYRKELYNDKEKVRTKRESQGSKSKRGSEQSGLTTSPRDALQAQQTNERRSSRKHTSVSGKSARVESALADSMRNEISLGYMSDKRAMPPPTIWNVNTTQREAGLGLIKPSSSRPGATAAGNKVQAKPNQSKIPSAFSNCLNVPLYNASLRSESVTLEVPVTNQNRFLRNDFLHNSVDKSAESFTEHKAATLIQRAYQKYRTEKMLISIMQESCRSPQSSSCDHRSNRSKSRESFRPFDIKSDKHTTFPGKSRGLSFKDYLKEGSLYFPERESVIVFGGIDPHSKYGDGRNTGRNIFRYNSEANQWDLVGELPQPRHHHAVVFLKGKVYLAGGTDPRDDEKGKTVVVGTVWSFDPVTRSWYKEKEMLTPRKNFGLAVTNGKLLAIGGQDKDGRILSTVEKYDPVTRVWEYIANLNTERTGAAASKYNDTVWVAGGMTSSRKNPLTLSVESYDAKNNVWIEQSPLRFPRCFGCLFSTNDVLYFIGGAGRASEKERTTSSCNAIDVWNPKENEWKLHFAMSIPRHGHAVAYLGTQILIIGGVTTAYLRALTDVECFCCERKTWVRGLTGLPVPLSGHGAVTLPPASLM